MIIDVFCSVVKHTMASSMQTKTSIKYVPRFKRCNTLRVCLDGHFDFNQYNKLFK